jgi:hypothetical protein
MLKSAKKAGGKTRRGRPVGHGGLARRIDITLAENIHGLAEACMKHRVISNRSEYHATLIREDWERRGRPV